MGLYPPRLSGGGHDSDSLRVQGVRSVAEEEEQSAPIDRREVRGDDGGDDQVSSGEQKKAWPFEESLRCARMYSTYTIY